MSPEVEAPLPARVRAALAWLAMPLAVGAALRLWNLGRQALLGDELHTLRRALRDPLAEILVRFQTPDTSLPLTALFHVLSELGVTLHEGILRAPSLVAGWLLAPIGGLFLARRAGAVAGALFAGLAATSPLLVIYSRNARAYAVAATLGLAALVLFVDAWERRSRARFVVAALVGFVAVWSLPTVVGVVGAPWAAALVATLRERRRGEPWRREFLAVSAALLAAGAVFTLASWRSVRVILEGRAGELEVREFGSIPEGIRLAAGARSPLVAAAILLAGIAGLALLARRRGFAGAVLASAAAAHALFLLALRDRSFEYSLGVGRSLLLGMPVLLCGTAAGLAELVPRRWRERRAAAVVAGALAALLPAATGPLPERLSVVPELLASTDRMRFTLPSAPFVAPLPALFGREPLASARVVVDAPWLTEVWYVRPAYGEALTHRRRLLLAMLDPFPVEKVRLRATVRPSPEQVLRSAGEALLLRSRPGELVLAADLKLEEHHLKRVVHRAHELDAAAARLRAVFLAAWGPPDASDDAGSVWDLRRLRREGVR